MPCGKFRIPAPKDFWRFPFASNFRIAGRVDPVQEFAWRVIETRCSYQGYERGQRTFWAYNTQATKLDTGLAYSIDILSERGWEKSEPPATIQMTILDDGRLHVIGLSSTFVGCR